MSFSPSESFLDSNQVSASFTVLDGGRARKVSSLVLQWYITHIFFVFVVMLMGFTESEARLGLRACHGDSTLAVDYITQRRQVKNAFLLARHAVLPYEKERVLKA